MSETGTEISLRLTRRFAAPREDVFDAWTSPEVLRRWWAAGERWESVLAEVDLRPGGRYRLAMRDPESGAVHTVGGEYREVARPRRLVYTWAWESPAGEPGESTVVVVDFHEEGEGTEVVLVHRGFSSEEARRMHVHGWEECLANLERRVFAAA